MTQAIGMLETRGLVALVQGTDAMLKAANVELAGPMKQVGNAMVTAVVVGDVAAVQAAVDAGAAAVKSSGGEVPPDRLSAKDCTAPMEAPESGRSVKYGPALLR